APPPPGFLRPSNPNKSDTPTLIRRMVTGRIKFYRSEKSDFNCIGYRVDGARLAKAPQPQRTAVAGATCHVHALVAGPGQVKWRPKLETTLDNLTLSKMNYRSDDLNSRLRPGAEIDHPGEGVVVFGPAIGIAGTVFCDGADIDAFGPDRFSPAGCD